MYKTDLTVLGTVITKVEMRHLADGTATASFRLASNERRYDKSSLSWVDGDTLYLTVKVWRELAENVHTSLRLGDSVVVQGRLFSRQYDKDGRRQSVVELEASAVGPNLRWATAAVTRTRRGDSAGVTVATMAAGVDEAQQSRPEAAAADREPGGDDPWTTDLVASDAQGGADEAARDPFPNFEAGLHAVHAEAAVGS